MTHTEQQGHPSRRSFLAGAIAVAATSALVGGLGIASAPSAVAATDSSYTFVIDVDNPGVMATSYVNALRNIRSGTRAHRFQTSEGLVDATNENGANEYTTIDVMMSEGSRFIRVYIRNSDAYVMGWRVGDDYGFGEPSLGDFFTLEAGVVLDSDRQTVGNTNTRFQGLATYPALAQQGASRLGLTIGAAGLDEAVRQLHNGANAPTRDAARAILRIIVALAEGARFRQQALRTAQRLAVGQDYVITDQDMALQNNWGTLSERFLGWTYDGEGAAFWIGQQLFATLSQIGLAVMLIHHSNKIRPGHDKELLEGTHISVASSGLADFWTVQEAINDAEDYGTNDIYIERGTYHEVISVPSDKSWLTIQGLTGNPNDVVIYNTRCNGMINPATGTKYGTQGSAVATFRPPNLTVKDLRIVNTFDRAAHPEISPYETQAVAVCAMGDRQVYQNVQIWSHQDTLLCKGVTPLSQARQWFVNCHIRGDVDFIFGNATAVIDRSTIQMLPWPSGTMMAPNTEGEKKYGILISSCTISTSGVANDTMHLGRPWNNTENAWPQAIVRNCDIGAGIKDAQPWTDMLPDEPWQTWARFAEYHNFGPGAGFTSNSPQLTDAEAADYTVQKYLAGTDGWNPAG
jgi:pectin methylesterase-like acyl-CoA thioesterase